MITGFNTNVRHGGRVFHVQTEDSGRDHPHVISHLYFGGTILSSEKREYAEHVDAPDLTSRVRQLMDEQHRSMLARLAAGDFDPVILERLGAGEATDGATAPRSEKTGPAAPANAAGAEAASSTDPAEPDGRAFGEGIVSEKPLDEVILDYLVDKSRTRGSQ